MKWLVFQILFFIQVNLLANNLITSHAFSFFDKPKYQENFTHFDYVDTQAKKGGSLSFGGVIEFNSLNPFNAISIAPEIIEPLCFATLGKQSLDEDETFYHYLADKFIWPDNFSWFEVTLNKNARFSDQSPITTKDVDFSLVTLQHHGKPIYQAQYQHITGTEILSEHKIRFYFKQPYSYHHIVSLIKLPILQKTYFQKIDFEKPHSGMAPKNRTDG